MTLSQGTTLGPYAVTAKIGEGGMAAWARSIRLGTPGSTGTWR